MSVAQNLLHAITLISLGVCANGFSRVTRLGVYETCGTGIGMSIAANRFREIRAALCTTEFHAKMSRAHNDSNVLVLGSRITCAAPALEILHVYGWKPPLSRDDI